MNTWLRKIKNFFKKFFIFIVLKLRMGKAVNSSVKLGNLGENLAVKYLKRQGYSVVARNWKSGKGEIDVVAIDKKHKMLVFVEVKLRAHNAIESGYFAVDKDKKYILQKTCLNYIQKFAKPETTYRFDIIDIQLNHNNKACEIFHFENVDLF